MDYSRFMESEAPVIVLQAGQVKLEEAEKMLIIATLKRARFNRTRAAKILGIGIRTLQRKIKQYADDAERANVVRASQVMEMGAAV